MSYRRKFDARIEKKEQEIQELEIRIREEKAYLQALQDSLKLLPRDTDSEGSAGIRPGSLVARALDTLRSSGKPMHVVDILKAIGEEPSREKRGALSGSLSAYVRRQEIFCRPEPNTFGLLEWKAPDVSPESPEPPEGFGDLSVDDE